MHKCSVESVEVVNMSTPQQHSFYLGVHMTLNANWTVVEKNRRDEPKNCATRYCQDWTQDRSCPSPDLHLTANIVGAVDFQRCFPRVSKCSLLVNDAVVRCSLVRNIDDDPRWCTSVSVVTAVMRDVSLSHGKVGCAST